MLGRCAPGRALDRDDLAAAGRGSTHRPPAEPVVVCHGDMHPFNLLVDAEGATTVLDWSAAMLAPGTYDLGVHLSGARRPAARGPRSLRPVVRRAGRALSRRFLRAYDGSRQPRRPGVAGVAQGVVCLRALVEVAGWVAAGTIEGRVGHPWLIGAGDPRSRGRTRTGDLDRRSRGQPSGSVEPDGGWVSYMRTSTTKPDRAVRPATAQIAAAIENASARTPARRAPTANPPSRQSR